MKDRRALSFRNLLLALFFITVFFSVNKAEPAEATECVVNYDCNWIQAQYSGWQWGISYNVFNCSGFVRAGDENSKPPGQRGYLCGTREMSWTVIEDPVCNQCVSAPGEPPEKMSSSPTGEPPCKICEEKITKIQKTGSSVNYGSGNLYDDIDLVFNTNFKLSYNSLDPAVGPFGRGWTHTFNTSVSFYGVGDYVIKYRGGDGSVVKFYKRPDGRYFPIDPNYAVPWFRVTPTGFHMREQNGIEREFDLDGRLIEHYDRNGNATILTYDVAGNLVSVTDKNNRTLAFDIDPLNGKIGTIKGPNGHFYYFKYTGDYLTEVEAPVRTVIRQFTYNAAGLLETKTEAIGSTTYTYDGQDRLLTATDQDGRTNSIAYDLPSPVGYSGNTVSITKKNGGVWTYTYKDSQKGPVFETDPLGNSTTYEYNSRGQFIKEIAANGAETTYLRDRADNIMEMTDALGNFSASTHNLYGGSATATDALGNVTTRIYDGKGNLLTDPDALGHITTYQYDAVGNVTSIHEALGKTTIMTYDAQNNLVSTITPLSGTTTFTYDVEGNVTSTTNALGETSTFIYSGRNLLLYSVDAGGNNSSYTYDAEGNKTSVTDGNGKVTLYAYNNDGKLIKTTDAAGGVTIYSYIDTGTCAGCGGGGEDDLASFTDANGNTTSYSYDLMSRLLTETDALGAVTNYSYDSVGNLSSSTDAASNVTTYGYDLLNRLTTQSSSDDTLTFAYDELGNMTNAGNTNSSYEFIHDANGNILTSTDSNGRAVTYSYNALNDRASMIDVEGNVTSYSYYSGGRLYAMNGFAGHFSFSYDPLGRRTQINYPTPAVKNYAFDLSGRLSSITQASANVSFMEELYTYDGVGNILTRSRLGDTAQSYLYDSLYRLVGEGTNETYTYDAVGNRLTAMSYFGGNGEFTYDETNRIITPGFSYDINGNLTTKQSFAPVLEEPPAVKPGGGMPADRAARKAAKVVWKEEMSAWRVGLPDLRAFLKGVKGMDRLEILREYFMARPPAHATKNGSFRWTDPVAGAGALKTVTTVTDGTAATAAAIIGFVPTTTTSYEYDSGGRLKGVIFEGGTMALKYDVFGRLVNIIIEKTTGEITNKTLFYDGEDVIARYDETGALVARYAHGPGVDEPLAYYTASDGLLRYLHSDNLGSIVNVTLADGTVESTNKYDSFGNLADPTGMSQRFSFTGREIEIETGLPLYYYRARFYDSEIGRFLTKDPIGLSAGDTNFYAYVGNNPINFVDPSGLANSAFGAIYDP
ncbi:MAG: RHS repeat-associated core domain-containing protein, partial [Thermodesulfobacteriota bacterium]